jgi:uncharacterized membrane protein
MTDIIEPLKVYESELKDKLKEETEKYWKELIKSTNTDIEANKTTCTEYYNIVNNEKLYKHKLAVIKLWQGFFRVISIIMIIVGIIMAIYGANGSKTGILVGGIILVVVAIIILVLAQKLPKNKIASLKEIIANLAKQAQEKLNLAYKQMSKLNNAYDWNIPAKLVNKLNTVLEFDEHFDVKKYQYLHDKYGLDENFDDKTSTLAVESGSILGNPFLMVKTLNQYWYTHTYENSITIHWTTTVHTKNGTSTQYHTETLTAYVDKPAAGYNDRTYLIYGNEAAPDLKFSRGPSGIDGMNENQIKKMIKKESKGFDKMARKALTDNDPNTNYVRFGNEEFESLFGGENRDNEVQFRLLFTPLAQQNLIKLIRENKYYGDDWYFEKNKKINFIQSKHSQTFDYKADPEYFIDFDASKAHERFITYNNEYFKSFFFDLAPLISIPLYQQTKTKEYIYKRDFPGNVTYYEDEVLANQFGQSYFEHSQSQTTNILKAKFRKNYGKTDSIIITAHGFNKVSHTEYIDKMGGDGKLHTIPVEWFEYIPVTKDTEMAVQPQQSSREEFLGMINSQEFKTKMAFAGAFLYERGLFGAILGAELGDSVAKTMQNVFSNNNTNSNNNGNVNIGNNVKSAINKATDASVGEIKSGIDEAMSKVKTNIDNGQNNNSGGQGSN